MNELKPTAWIEDSNIELLHTEGRAVVYEVKQECALIATPRMTPLYAITDTHRVVSVEDLKNVADKLDFWINMDDTRSMSESEYKSWLALGHQSKTVTRLRAIIDNKEQKE